MSSGAARHEARIAQLEAHVAQLQASVDELRAHRDTVRGPRDEADRAVLRAMYGIVGGGTFRASDALTRSRRDPAFAAILRAADVASETDVGYLLRACRGAVLDGCGRLARVGKDAAGAIWQFVSE